MESVKPASCENAPCSATLEDRTVHIRRGDRTVEARRWFWRCEYCTDPVEDGAYEFIDPALRDRNDAAARDAWLKKYGEQLPLAERLGRKSAERLENPAGSVSNRDPIRTETRRSLREATDAVQDRATQASRDIARIGGAAVEAQALAVETCFGLWGDLMSTAFNRGATAMADASETFSGAVRKKS